MVDPDVGHDLIDACIARPVNESAWRQFFVHYRPLVQRTVAMALRPYGGWLDATDADDIVQLVFLKIFENLGSFDSSKASLSTFIRTISTRTIIDQLRKSSKLHSAKQELLDRDALQYGVTDEALLWDQVLTEVEELGPERAEMIRSYFIGVDTAEICSRFGVTRANLYSIISRFRARVRPLFYTSGK
jgi:RNA polymerase sigma factor (sigma-70 family)